MKALRLLGLPWMALSDGSRKPIAILSTVLAGLTVLGAAFSHTGSTPSTAYAAHIAALMDLVFWAAAMSSSILLLRTATRLRLPALTREVCASLALYATLTIALPALVLGALGGHVPLALVEIALGAGVGLGYASLPVLLGTFFVFVPALSDQILARWLPMPAHSVDGFIAWAAPCTIVLWLTIGWFWHSASQRSDGMAGWRKSILLTWRSKSWYGHDAARQTATQSLRQRGRWLQPVASLQGSGPDRAVTSLRLALGGWAMPQTTASRMRFSLIWLINLALAVLLVAWQSASQPDNHFSLALVYIGIVSPIFAQTQIMALQRRWSRNSGEVLLLALLPGLGTGVQAKRSVLCARLLPALVALGLLLVAACGVAAWFHMGIVGWLVLPLDQVIGMAMLVAFTLAILGGIPLNGWSYQGFTIAVIIVVGTDGVLATKILSPTAVHITLLVLALVCTVLFGLLASLGMKGWRRLALRPHPFLPVD